MQWPERPTCHQGAFPTPGDTLTWRAPRDGDPFRRCGYCGSIHPGDLLEQLGKGATLHGADWKYGWPHKFYVEGIPHTRAGQPIARGATPIGDDPVRRYLAVTVGEHDCDLLLKHVAHVAEVDPKLLQRDASRRLFERLVLSCPADDTLVESRAADRLRRVVELRSKAGPGDQWAITATHDPMMVPATTAHAKWYNEHLLDHGYADGALEALIQAIERHSAIKFVVDPNGALRYEAPSYGFQRP